MDLMAEFFNRFEPIILKTMDPLVVVFWRLGLGRLFNLWPSLIGRILVIKHYDQKNGAPVFTPVNYFEQENAIYFTDPCQREDTDLSRNIMANPQVEVWLPDGWYAGQADLIPATPGRLPLMRKFFQDNPITARILQVDLLLEDQDFELSMKDFPLVRVIRQSPRTGVNGPGGLAWLWPFILILLLGLRPRRRR